MNHVFKIKAQLEKLSDTLAIVADVKDRTERIACIRSMQSAIIQLYSSVRGLDDRPVVALPRV